MNKRELTSRERVLAIVCVGACALGLARYGILNPLGGVRRGLDTEIATKEARLELFTEAEKLVQWVDGEYEQYRLMMSDEKTDEEVRQNLQQEIHALASKSAITVPTIKQGLTEEFPYYKRYLVAVDIAGRPERVANFLALLEQSPKLLHVEHLSIERKGDQMVRGRITVSRSLVASAEQDMPMSEEQDGSAAAKLKSAMLNTPAPVNHVFNGGFEAWDDGSYPNGWEGYRFRRSRDIEHKVEGSVACKLVSLGTSANFTQDLTLKSGTTYTWGAHAAVEKGRATLSIIDDLHRTRQVAKGVQELDGAEMRYYEQRFTTGGRPGGNWHVKFRIGASGNGTVIYIDNVSVFEGSAV